MENSDDILLPVIINVLMDCYTGQNYRLKHAAADKTIRSFSDRAHLSFILRMPIVLHPLRDLLLSCPDFGKSERFASATRNPEVWLPFKIIMLTYLLCM